MAGLQGPGGLAWEGPGQALEDPPIRPPACFARNFRNAAQVVFWMMVAALPMGDRSPNAIHKLAVNMTWRFLGRETRL
jgi:hypothetical protein